MEESEAPYISFVPSTLISARNQGLAVEGIAGLSSTIYPLSVFWCRRNHIFSQCKYKVTCRIYNIKYKTENNSLPTEIIIDLNKYIADVGFGNMNSKAYQAIKDITGYEAESCKVEMISRYPGFWGRRA